MQKGSQMSDTDDIEYVMARISAMSEAKKELDRAIRADKKYIREKMGDREELVTDSFTASTFLFKRKQAMKLDEIRKVLGDEAADSVTKTIEVEYLNINPTEGELEPWILQPGELLPDWAMTAYKMLHGNYHREVLVENDA